MPENQLAWECWQILNLHGRPPGPLVPSSTDKKRQRMMVMPFEIEAAVKFLEALDGTQDDLKKVLELERIIYPKMNQ
jgi:hypothetical protein